MPILNKSKVLTAIFRCSGLKSSAYHAKEPYFMLILIQRDDCALCDRAWEVLFEAGIRDFESQFIDGDDALEKSYGFRVPVLRCDTVELNWPFTAEQVRNLISEDGCD